GVELAVQDREDVPVERGRDTGGVVVRGLEPARVLDEVGTEQERVVRSEASGDGTEELGPAVRIEVPDRAPEERDEARAAGGQPVEVALEVADDRVHVDTWVLDLDGGGGVTQRRFAHVERDEPPEGFVRGERVEQQPRLLGRPRAELHERVGGGAHRDITGVPGEDGALGAGRVVLRQAGDLVEQAATLLVVEPLRREDLRRRGEPGTSVGTERGGQVVGPEVDVDAGRGRGRGDDGPPGQNGRTTSLSSSNSTTERSATASQVASSSYGSDATTTAPARSRSSSTKSELRHAVPAMRSPSVSRRFMRASVCFCPTSATTETSASTGEAPASSRSSTSANSTSESVPPAILCRRVSLSAPRSARPVVP